MKKFKSKKEVLHYIFVQPFKVLLSPIINLINWWNNLPFDAPPDWSDVTREKNYNHPKDWVKDWQDANFLKDHPKFGPAKTKRLAGCWCTYRVYDKKYVITVIDGVRCVFHLSDFYNLPPDSSNPYLFRIDK